MEVKNKIVIFGGSFNPPLNSHFAIAEQVLNQYEQVDKVIFIPVNKKYEKDSLIENKHRYEMIKRVVEKNDRFEVSDIDMDGNRSLSTIETIEAIQNIYKDKEIYFLIGSDNLKEIHTWNRADELISKYRLLVMERGTDIVEDIIENSALLRKYQGNIEKLEQQIKSNFNSTYVRGQISHYKSVRYLMPDEVYTYIEENNLYRS